MQPKKSYQAHYITEPLPYKTLQCSYLENEKMRYSFVDGTKAPCCFMIDSTKVLPTTQIRQHLAQKNIPSCCTQCGELTGVKRLYIEEMKLNTKGQIMQMKIEWLRLENSLDVKIKERGKR